MFRYRAIRNRPYPATQWFKFGIEDCPAYIDKKRFILCAKENTPILELSCVVRGHPKYDMFEGDIVMDKATNQRLGLVVYKNGFFMQKTEKSYREVIPFKHIYLKRGTRATIKRLQTLDRTPIVFCYDNQTFNFQNFVSVDGVYLNIVENKVWKRIPIHNIREIVYQDKENNITVFDGDFVNGTPVTIDNVGEIFVS